MELDNFTISNWTNVTEEAERDPEKGFWHFTKGFAKVTMCIFALICTALIIYALVRLKKMSEPKNFYLFNWGIYNSVYLVVSPFSQFLEEHMREGKLECTTVVCITFEIEASFAFIAFISMSLLALDWLAENIFPKYHEKFKSRLFLLKIFFYLFATMYIGYSCIHCLSECEISDVSVTLKRILFVAISIAILHVVRLVYNRKSNTSLEIGYSLALPTIYALCWFPSTIRYNLPDETMNVKLYNFCIFFCEILTYVNPIVSAIYLSKHYSDFKRRFNEVTNCNCNASEACAQE